MAAIVPVIQEITTQRVFASARTRTCTGKMLARGDNVDEVLEAGRVA